MINISERFIYYRKLHNLSANKLSKELSVDPSTISKIERGTAFPSMQLLIKYCDFFNISLSEFFADDSDNLSEALKELLHSAKGLSPEQIKAFTEAFKTIMKG